MNAVVLLGHGSRAAGVAEQMEWIARLLASSLAGMVVRAAHRELCEPSLEQVVKELVEQGHRRIVVVPYFLHLGNHLQHDIPEQLAALERAYPNVQFALAEHLGFDERFVPVLKDRVTSALERARETIR